MSNNNKKSVANLNDLVEALNDGIAFYDHAATEANSAVHRQLFLDMSRVKRAIATDLKAEVLREGGEPANDGTWLGDFRQGYADLKAKMTKDPDAAYISSLEEQEDRVLHSFRDAVDSDKPSRVRELAIAHLPEVTAMHDRMRALKQANKA